MMAAIEVKKEPPEEPEHYEDDQETLTDNFVNIKSEVPESIQIKSEPTEKENIITSTTVKIEPCSESDDEKEDSDSTKSKSRKRKDSSDDEYILPSIKKKPAAKKASNVKPSVKGKAKSNPDMIYAEEITRNVEIVTITEDERRVEHSEVLESRRHMRFVCEWCALGFVVEDAYQDHMKMHSPENGEFECEICHTRLKSADVLYRHKLRHFRRYRCSICSLRLRDKDTAAAHVMKDHHGSCFICTHCDKGFKRPQYLKRHIEQMHTRAVEFKCPVCQRVFYERGWYRCHVRSHNEEVQRSAAQRLPCAQCGRLFKNKTHLKRHMLTHDDDPVDCPRCERTFKNPEVLRTHCRKQHADKSDAHDTDTECQHCGRVCATPSMLHRHLQRMHADRTKRFECSHCGRRYLTKGEVRSHIMWSHMRRRGGHVCGCGRVFRSPARLRQHQQKQHLQLPEPRDKACPICGKAFANQQVLTRHIKGHSGETYPCTECGQTFKTQSYVKVHYKIKHLNMTRAQVKAESKRKLLMVENLDEFMNARVRSARQDMNDDPLYFSENIQIKQENNSEIEVPKFEMFIDIPR